MDSRLEVLSDQLVIGCCIDRMSWQGSTECGNIHAIWQWGIVDADLIGRMSKLGFKMQFYKNCGYWPQLQNVENHAFVFCKSRSAAR
jgi:hypothetical protein